METGISDFHKMVITVLNFFYRKQKPIISYHRNYKTFNTSLFKEELKNELLNIDINSAELVEFTNTVYQYLTSMHLYKENTSVETILRS